MDHVSFKQPRGGWRGQCGRSQSVVVGTQIFFLYVCLIYSVQDVVGVYSPDNEASNLWLRFPVCGTIEQFWMLTSRRVEEGTEEQRSLQGSQGLEECDWCLVMGDDPGDLAKRRVRSYGQLMMEIRWKWEVSKWHLGGRSS